MSADRGRMRMVRPTHITWIAIAATLAVIAGTAAFLMSVYPTLPDLCDIAIINNGSYGFLDNKIEEGIHIIRNPLDIIVSAYFSHKNTHSTAEWPKLRIQRQFLNLVGKQEGFRLTWKFLERPDFYDGAEGPLYALRRWNFDDDRFVTLRMEDAVLDPNGVFDPLLGPRYPSCRLPDARDHTFEAVSGRKRGVVDDRSHYRSGLPEQWRHELPAAVVEYVRERFEVLLTRFYPNSLVDTPGACPPGSAAACPAAGWPHAARPQPPRP